MKVFTNVINFLAFISDVLADIILAFVLMVIGGLILFGVVGVPALILKMWFERL